MSKLIYLVSTVAVLIIATALSAWAVTPDEILTDVALEARAREISQLLRCVVCQNQSIDDSSAPLAKDLRILVRERLALGDDNNKAIAFIVERYGNFVLLKPPIQLNTLLLWLGPTLLLALAGATLVRTLKSQSDAADTAPPLSAGEEACLDELMSDRSCT